MEKEVSQNHVPTQEIQVIDVVGLGLEAIDSFFDVINRSGEARRNTELQKLAHIGKTLVSDVKWKARQVDAFARRNCGAVIVETLPSGHDGAGEDVLIGARFETKQPSETIVNSKDMP